jgi:cbb3-type cytochrome oxidase subunit 3
MKKPGSTRDRAWNYTTDGEMMKPILLLLLFLFLLSGCAATYRHPTKDASAFEKDRQECDLIARKALAAKGIPGT